MADESTERMAWPEYLPGEEAAVRQVIALAEQHGYGNLMQRLHIAWNRKCAAEGMPAAAHTPGPALPSYERLGFKGYSAPVDLLHAYEVLYAALERIGHRGEPAPRGFARTELKKVPRHG